MRFWSRVCLLAAVCVFALTTVSFAGDASAGRDIAAKYGPAVVKVQLVLKISVSYMGQGENQEQKSEINGTVVDPSGLTVVSMSATDPGDMIREMFGDSEGMQINSEVTDVKIRLADGKEIPAKVVLRDKDLDLAFIRPVTKPAEPLPYLDLKNNCRLDVLDQTVVVTRLGKIANRTVAASLSRIQAMVEKPRRFYTVGMPSSSDAMLGSPVFSVDGKSVGIVLLRVMPGQGRSSMSSGDSPILPVIIPAEDIAPVAAQAPEDAPKAPAASTPAKPAK